MPVDLFEPHGLNASGARRAGGGLQVVRHRLGGEPPFPTGAVIERGEPARDAALDAGDTLIAGRRWGSTAVKEVRKPRLPHLRSAARARMLGNSRPRRR